VKDPVRSFRSSTPPLLHSSILLLALLAGSMPARAQQTGPPDGVTLLANSASRIPQLAVAGVETVTVWRQGSPERITTQVYRSGRGQVRSEILEPRSRKGRISFDDGHTRWSYDPRRHTLVHESAVDVEDTTPDFEELRRHYRVEVDPVPQQVARRRAWLVTARSVEGGKPWRRLWLDSENGFPLRIEKHHADGVRQSLSEFQIIQFPDSLPEALFKRPLAAVVRQELSIGVEMAASLESVRAALGIQPAATLPAGYALRSAAVIGTGPSAVYHLRYDDGWSVVSLFMSGSLDKLPGAGASEKVSLAHGEARLHQGAHLAVLGWSEGPVHCALVGDVTPALLTRLADASGVAGTAAAHEAPTSFLTDLWVMVPALAAIAGAALWSALFFARRRASPA
jgi:outer membrane lipoprotein-sorting protein